MISNKFNVNLLFFNTKRITIMYEIVLKMSESQSLLFREKILKNYIVLNRLYNSSFDVLLIGMAFLAITKCEIANSSI